MNTKPTQGTAVAIKWSSHAPTTIKVGDVVIAECGGHGNDTEIDIANARRLALCWNNHYELVDALKNIEALANDPAGSRFTLRELFGTFHETSQIEGNKARAILAKVKGGE